MTRPNVQNVQAQRLLAAALLIAFVMALLPIRFVSWIDSLRSPLNFLLSPISSPAKAVASWATRARDPRSDDPAVRAALDELEKYKAMAFRLESENRRLTELVSGMQGAAYASDLPVKQLAASVYGNAPDLSAGLLLIRAGERDGVHVNAVAMTPSMQLVGKVVRVDSRTCAVLPITARPGETFRAMVMIDQTTNGLACELSPTGKGTLRGDVAHRVDSQQRPILPEVGQEVRLADPNWPANSSMLIVGRVEAVDPSPKMPQRKTITVRPTVERLDKVSEVVLRMTASDLGARSAEPKPAGKEGK